MRQIKRRQGRAGRGVDPRRRQWIYQGLAMPPGVAVVHEPASPRRAERVLLIGGDVAQGIAPPLRALAGSLVALSVVARPSFTVSDWLRPLSRPGGWLDLELPPDVVLLGLSPTPALMPLDAYLQQLGITAIWLSRSSGVPGARVVQPPAWSDRMGATAVSYAAWAAHVWAMIR